MNHPKHPACPACGKALYKAFEKGKVVKKADPWNFCRNESCARSGPQGLGATEKEDFVRHPSVVVKKAKNEVYGEGYAAAVDAERGKIQPVRGSALGRLAERTDFTIENGEDGSAPKAGVQTPESVPECEVFFWRKKFKSNPEPILFCSHVTKFTKHWCEKHQYAHNAKDCPACAKDKTPGAEESKPAEHPAVQKTREQLEPLVKMLAPTDTPPAAVGLIMALLNQATGNKTAANLLIDEYGLDKQFGLQKF